MTNYSKTLLLGILIFCVAYWLGCGGGSRNLLTTSPTGVSRMLLSRRHYTAIFPNNAGNQPALASLFALQTSPSNPSPVAQSYESYCGAYSLSPRGGGSVSTSMHAALGNSGLVAVDILGGNGGVCGPVLSSVGVDEGTNVPGYLPQGYPIILDGTVNTLVVFGSFNSGNRFRCDDTTNRSPLSDGTYVRAYYDLAHDAILLGSGTTQLAPTCSISVPPGDDVQLMWIQWLKN